MLICPVREEVKMNAGKPEHIKEKIWEQHLRWLDLVSNECRSNQLRREREKQRRDGKA